MLKYNKSSWKSSSSWKSMEIDGKCVGENDENHEVSVRYNFFFMEMLIFMEVL
jgi:hypothetical protein